MDNYGRLKEQIKSVYFSIISDEKFNNYKKTLENLLIALRDLLNTDYIGVYGYNDFAGKYEVITDIAAACDIPAFLEELERYSDNIKRQSGRVYTNVVDVISSDVAEENSVIVHLHSNNGSESVHLLLLMVRNNHFQTGELLLIKQETERFLSIANFFRDSIEDNQKNEYLYSLSSHLNSSTDKYVVLSRIVESLENTFQKYTHYLLLSHDFEADHTLPIQSIDHGDTGTKRSSSKAFISGEIQIESEANGTYLYAPLLGNQGVYGVIRMIAPAATQFNEKEMVFIAQIAQTAGKAIESVTLYENSIHLVSDLQLINDVTHQLNSNLEFNELMKILKNELITICQAMEIGFIYYRVNPTEDYEILTESTSYFHSNEGHIFAEFMIKEMKERSEPILSGDFTKDYPVFPYHSIISIPMITPDFNYGYIIVTHEEKSFFTLENFKLMQSLIRHSTLALTNTILKDKLEKAVITDYLTQLYSRNYLDDMLRKHMKKDDCGAFILFDIDDFKSINDTYGHHVGDKVIIQIADVMREHISENELPARWGGEEFALYIPYGNLRQGFEMAKRLKVAVANHTNPAVTISCGVSTWSTQYVDSTSAIFIRADKALYKAKETGKNKIITEEQLWDFVKK